MLSLSKHEPVEAWLPCARLWQAAEKPYRLTAAETREAGETAQAANPALPPQL